MPRLVTNLAACAVALAGFAIVLALRYPVADPLKVPVSGDWQGFVFSGEPVVPAAAPLVVWAGDSTILKLAGPPYPELVTQALLKPAGISSVTLSGVGFTFYQYYCLMGPLRRSHPALVVLALNLGTFWTIQSDEALLCSDLPAGELLRSATLPLTDAGMPPPHLLLAQSLRWPWVRRASRVLDVARGEIDGWRTSLGLPPRVGYPAASWRLYQMSALDPQQYERGLLDAWREGARPRSASLRMLAATVRLARASGAKVLVVVSPVPVEVLVAAGVWDRAGYADVIDRITTTVTRAGGVVADLHDAVDVPGFLHGNGFNRITAHMNERGAHLVTEHLRPVVASMLNLPLEPGPEATAGQ